jgi:Tfp pilus assembly protein PilN
MLRTNLATRPFYNERAIHLALAAAAIVVLAITLVNVSRIVTLSRRNTELSSRTNADRAEASRLSTEAVRIRRSINKDELALVVNAAQEANALIDQRTFSWTEFFNQIESTIPPDVMLTSVRPSFKDAVTSVTMMVKARQNADISEFMEKLEATGLFENVLAPSSETSEEGLWRATIEAVYVSKAAAGEEPRATSTRPSATAAPPAGKSDQPKPGAAPAQPPRDRGRK